MEDDIEPTTTPPVTDPPPTHDGTLHDAVTALQAKVESLEAIVTGIVASGGDDDSSPVKKPWTHRSFGAR